MSVSNNILNIKKAISYVSIGDLNALAGDDICWESIHEHMDQTTAPFPASYDQAIEQMSEYEKNIFIPKMISWLKETLAYAEKAENIQDPYEDERDKLVSLVQDEIKKNIDSFSPEMKKVINSLTSLVNKQEEALSDILGNLEAETIEEAKEEISYMKNELAGGGKTLVREKFYEKVEFVASEIRDIDTERNKLLLWNGQNGDLYMSICPESHRMGISMRFERSGGCSTKNPKLLTALMDAYDAIAGNFK